MLLAFPTCQVVNVQKVDAAGLRYQQVDFECRVDTDVSTTTDLGQSPFRIHFG
jgi:hypothetical protein